MKKYLICSVIGVAVAFLAGMAVGNIQAQRSKFTYYKLSVLAKHVDYFAVELVDGLYARAEERYSNKDYAGALQDLEKNYAILNITEPQGKVENTIRQEKDISCVKKLIELNKKIEKDPKNYKLILERADIKAHPRLSMFISESWKDSFCSDWEGAYEDYNTALEINPNLKDVYEKRADALGWTIDGVSFPIQETKKYEAIFKEKMQRNLADYQKAIELNGRKPKLLQKLAGTYISLEQPEKAIPLLEEVLKSGDNSANYGLAMTYDRLGKPEKVIEYIDKFLEKENSCSSAKNCDCQYNNRYIYYVRAKAAFKLHRYKEWFNNLKKAHYLFLHD